MKVYITYMVALLWIVSLEIIPLIGSQVTCNTNCQSPVDVGSLACNLTTGACKYGCKPKFTGDICDIECGENCRNCSLLSDNISTLCHQCEDSFYFKDNSSCRPCGSRCLTNSSSSLPVCRPTDGRCEFGCEPTYYGASCNVQCSATCKDRKCNRDTGQCLSGCASDQLSGDLCVESCNTGCINARCEQNGTCKQGCTREFWGSSCNTQCSLNCNNSTVPDNRACDSDNGTCLYGCTDGQHGSLCEVPCPENCLDYLCEQNGTCKLGCTAKYWGLTCNLTCSSSCLNPSNSDNRTCDIQDGACLFGCVDGHWGPRCELSCPSNCVTNNCNDVFGNCTAGCKSRYYGSHCNESCSLYCVDNECDRMTGMCQCEEGISGTLCINAPDPVQDGSEGGTNILALVFIILAIFVVVIFILFFFYLVRRE